MRRALERLRFLESVSTALDFYRGIGAARWERWYHLGIALKVMYGFGTTDSLFPFDHMQEPPDQTALATSAGRYERGVDWLPELMEGFVCEAVPSPQREYLRMYVECFATFLRRTIDGNMAFAVADNPEHPLVRKRLDFAVLDKILPYQVLMPDNLGKKISRERWETWRTVCYQLKQLFGLTHLEAPMLLGFGRDRRVPDIAASAQSGDQIARQLRRVVHDTRQPDLTEYVQTFLEITASFLAISWDEAGVLGAQEEDAAARAHLVA